MHSSLFPGKGERASRLVALIALGMTAFTCHADTIWSEGFETDGLNSRYTTNDTTDIFNDGNSEDYYGRESNSSADRSYTDGEGSYWWGGQDHDDDGGPDERTVIFTNINISGYENLEFLGLFAEERPELSGDDDQDDQDYIHVQYRIDGGEWQNLLWFESYPSDDNDPFFKDADFNGEGDSGATRLETYFQEFTNSIAGTGSSLDIQVEAHVDSGDEDWAMDNLRVTGDAIVGPPEAPTDIEITQTNSTSFVLDWSNVAGATNYALDVSTDSNFDSTIFSADFSGFTGGGFASSPTATQLDSDNWKAAGLSDGDGSFGGTHTSGDFARGGSSGGETTGGAYGFDVGSGNRALGVQPTASDWTPGSFVLKFQNNSGGELTDVDVSYTVYVYNDQDMANSFNFSHSANDSDYSDVSGLDYTSAVAAAGSPSWESVSRSTTISGLSVSDEGYYYLRWSGDDAGGSGSRDEFALDDVKVADSTVVSYIGGYSNRATDASSATVTGLTAQTKYYFRVRALGVGGTSPNSTTQEVETLSLVAPTALAASWTNATSFTSRWTSVSGATGYYLDVATNAGFTPSVGGDLIISEMCDPESYYRTNRFIEIYNAGISAIDLTDWSLQAIISTTGDNTNYYTWNLTGSISSGEALVCGDHESVGFTCDFTGAWYEANSLWTGGDSDDGARLLNASSQVVDIAYLKGANDSTYRLTNEATARTSFQTDEWDTIGVDEAGADATPGTHTCDYPDRDAGDFVLNFENRDVGDVTQFLVTGLVSSTIYHYRVRAYDATATSPNSNTQSVETLVKPEPSNHPSGLSVATVTHRTIVLSWTDSATGNLPDGYLVQGSTAGYDAIGNPSDGSNVANDQDFSNGNYAYKVEQGVETLEIRGLSEQQDYYFKIFPYANSFSAINYKIDGSVREATAETGVKPFEDMEDVEQLSYVREAVALDSGEWQFTEAMLGRSGYDTKADQQAVKIRTNGWIAMSFDTNYIESISVEHANYYNDTGGSLEVYMSTNSGTDWSKIGSQVACESSLTTNSFAVHKKNAVRFRIKQTGGNRINVDNIRLVPYQPHGTIFIFN